MRQNHSEIYVQRTNRAAAATPTNEHDVIKIEIRHRHHHIRIFKSCNYKKNRFSFDLWQNCKWLLIKRFAVCTEQSQTATNNKRNYPFLFIDIRIGSRDRARDTHMRFCGDCGDWRLLEIHSEIRQKQKRNSRENDGKREMEIMNQSQRRGYLFTIAGRSERVLVFVFGFCVANRIENEEEKKN